MSKVHKHGLDESHKDLRVESSPDPQRSAAKKGPNRVIGLEDRKRYDLWSRSQSDTFRWKVAEVLESRTKSNWIVNSDPYTFLTGLPDVCWDDKYSDSLMALSQVRALFSKDEDMLSPIDTEAVAVQSFLESEQSCKSINDAFLEDRFGVTDSDVGVILFYAQRKIAEILGDAPCLDDLKPRFGPGATVTCRKKTGARHKLSTPPSISRTAIAIAAKLRDCVPRWYQAFGEMPVVAGRLEFVNKNYKTKRPIVIGPTLTGMFQLAIGSVMKLKLLHCGIDLREGQAVNKERARSASLTGCDGTIDLKAASDSISYMLVLHLLPIDWFQLLDYMRDDRVLYRSSTIELEKFSSMGNGYTFELESLLFYSLAYGIARLKGIPFDAKTLSVYGDDIIAPLDLSKYIIEYFPKFGFTINEEKSFIDGPFRESCGGDYVFGVDVRPFFIRQRMTHHVLVSFYNHLMRKPHQDADRKIRELILSTLPVQFQLFGPDGYGDGHLVSGAGIHTYGRPHNREDGWEGFLFDTYVEVPQRDKGKVSGDKLLPFYMVGLRDECWSDLKYHSDILRGPFRDAFIRHTLRESGVPIDPYVIRKRQEVRIRGRKISVYVLGSCEGV